MFVLSFKKNITFVYLVSVCTYVCTHIRSLYTSGSQRTSCRFQLFSCLSLLYRFQGPKSGVSLGSKSYYMLRHLAIPIFDIGEKILLCISFWH